MKLKKLVLRDFIQQDEILSKKAQKWILGGYSSLCGQLSCTVQYICQCAGGPGLFVTCNESTAENWCVGTVNCREC